MRRRPWRPRITSYNVCYTKLLRIRRLLAERPQVTGVAAPGMPAGSPGMEVPGQPAEPYDVVTFDAQGRTALYERR